MAVGLAVTGPRRAGAVLLSAALLCACGLPVEQGVRSAGPVAPETVERGDIQVLPPGPRPDAGPREVVLGFLGAQTSADGGHALAREFLAAEAREEWDPGVGVRIYDPASVEVLVDPAAETSVTVRLETVATIDGDGAYDLDPGTTEDAYRLVRDAQGQLRLAEVPAGLRLTPAGAGRSFRARELFYLGTSAPDVPVERLVPDRVFLPAAGEADAVVAQLLDGPTSALRGAVATAVPDGVELRGPVTVVDGVVTVDLTGPVGALGGDRRRRLAAQLVWTLQTALPSVPSVRLLAEGRPLEVPGADELQDVSDWAAFDPEAAAGRAAALYVEDRRLRRLDDALPGSEATDGRLAVDAAVTSPASGRVAVVSQGDADGGPDVVRMGGSSGPFEPALAVGEVRSMSWGSGARGLWIVSGEGDGAAPRVRVVRDGVLGPPVEVAYSVPPREGPLATLRVSRDDARVAAVFGEGADRRLYVGRVEPTETGLRLTGLRSPAPGLVDVADVAWESGTSLVALAPLGTPNRLPVRIAVDGSEVEPVRTLGLDGEPETVAAAAGRPLVVGAVLAGRPVLLVEEGGLFRLQPGTGRSPAYPG